MREREYEKEREYERERERGERESMGERKREREGCEREFVTKILSLRLDKKKED